MQCGWYYLLIFARVEGRVDLSSGPAVIEGEVFHANVFIHSWTLHSVSWTVAAAKNRCYAPGTNRTPSAEPFPREIIRPNLHTPQIESSIHHTSYIKSTQKYSRTSRWKYDHHQLETSWEDRDEYQDELLYYTRRTHSCIAARVCFHSYPFPAATTSTRKKRRINFSNFCRTVVHSNSIS